jgi:hypothetical protein
MPLRMSYAVCPNRLGGCYTFSVSGVQVHDARLVAAMKLNSVTHILTFNATDFTRYATEGIVAVDPTTV